MEYSHNQTQASLFNFRTIGLNPEDSELYQMSLKIDWKEFIDEIKKKYCSNDGRNSKSIRLMLGLEMAKHYFGCSDEIIAKKLKTDISLMAFCGFDRAISDKEIPDSSTLTYFRKKLDDSIMAKIIEAVTKKVIVKLPPRKRTQVSSDTTVVPANITQPTDTKLLKRVIEKTTNIIDEIRKVVKEKIVLRGRDKINKVVKFFSLKKKKTNKEIKKIKTKMIAFSKKVLKKLEGLSDQLNSKQKHVVALSKEIIRQQLDIMAGKMKDAKDRIISFHESKLRAIFRGKDNGLSEFGKKLSMMVIGQRVALPNLLEYNNYSDTSVPKKDVEKFKNVTGYYPKEYSFDRGGTAKENHSLLKKLNIKDGIQRKGKCLNVPKRLYRQRIPSEGKFGTLKTRWGLNKIKYRSDKTLIQVGMASIMSNLRWAVNY